MRWWFGRVERKEKGWMGDGEGMHLYGARGFEAKKDLKDNFCDTTFGNHTSKACFNGFLCLENF